MCIALSSIVVKSSKSLYILDSGVHIFRESVLEKETKSMIKIKGVGGVNLIATEQGTHDQIGQYLIVPGATANLLITKYGIVVYFFDNKAVLETFIK